MKTTFSFTSLAVALVTMVSFVGVAEAIECQGFTLQDSCVRQEMNKEVAGDRYTLSNGDEVRIRYVERVTPLSGNCRMEVAANIFVDRSFPSRDTNGEVAVTGTALIDWATQKVCLVDPQLEYINLDRSSDFWDRIFGTSTERALARFVMPNWCIDVVDLLNC